ncbi:MAG TPA: hypothetical protein VLJ21_04020 [Candidatus Binatia bacterium]|nr:hypothetical protein [Candidatus Binatia bacterium]
MAKDRTLRIIIGILLILAGLPVIGMFGMMHFGGGALLGLAAIGVGLWLIIDAGKP